MSQEALERQPSTEIPDSGTINWERAVELLRNSSGLLAPQKEALINRLSQLVRESPKKEELGEWGKIEAYETFHSRIKGGLDEIKCEGPDTDDALRLVDEVFRGVLGISIDQLSPSERGEVKQISDRFCVGGMIDKTSILEALEELEEALKAIEED